MWRHIHIRVSYKGEYFYRSGSTKQELKGAALHRFLLGKQGLHWDGVPLPHVSVSDLDANALAYFRRQALKSQRLTPEIIDESDELLLEKLHLVEGTYFKRAVALLFHPDPERFFTGAYIKIGFFENNVDLRYQDEVHGGLFSQVNQTISVLKAKYLKAWISYEGLQRIESYPIPETALREAILNAVVHKDYASGIPIQISVYPDKLMIWNSGQLPSDWTLERLLGKHSSQPFNPDVANAFFRAGMIEAWGRGIERIMQECVKAGVPEPELRYERTGLWTVFYFLSEQFLGETTGKTTGRTTQKKILALLKIQPSITQRLLAAELGVSANGIKYHIDKMKSEGLIRHVGASIGGHWEVLQ